MTDDLHLEDELLSAVLDGEATAEESAHADACAACGARLSALRDASLLVRRPVPGPDATRRDEAIAAALTAAPSTVVPLRRRRPPPAWLAAAAAVVVAVLVVGLVQRGGDDDDAGVAIDDTAAFDTFAGSEEATSLAAAAPYDDGDIGAIDDETLGQRIDEALASGRVAEDATAPVASARGDADAAESAGAAAFACEAEVRSGNPELGTLVYRATGTREDEPVVVLAFEVDADRWIYVVAADGCAIRNQQTYRS